MQKDSKIKLNSGNEMPVMGLGTWQLTEDTAQTVAYAMDLGYSLIDTSGDYGTQPGVGKAFDESKAKRDDIFITSKVEETDENTYKTVQKCNLEMKIKCADMMLIHRPPKKGVGENLWQGLIKAKEDKITEDIGVSNYSVEQLGKLIDKSGIVPAVNQIEWTPFGHSKEMKAYCDEKGIIIMAYSPLTHGKKLDDNKLVKVAEKYEKSPAQVLIRWDLQSGVVPIPKANNKDHLEENIDVFDFQLDDSDMKELAALNENYSSLGDTLEYL